MSGTSIATFALAGVWLLAIFGLYVGLGPIIEESSDGDPEGEAFDRIVVDTIGLTLLLLAATNLAAGIGIHMEQPWGTAVAFAAIPLNVLSVVGAPWAIAHMVTLKE